MFKTKSNMFYLFMILFSTLMLISSNSWLNMWIWLEINLMIFITFMINNKEKMSIEASLLYFLIQTISSIILLFSVMMIMFKINLMNLLMISILIKIGSSPFHYWVPLIIEGLTWEKIFLILTWQKINALYMIYLNFYFNLLMIFMILSLIIGSVTGLNFTSMKKIMSFSSINQLSWLIMSLISNKMMKIYLIMYFYLMWIISKSFHLMNLNFMNQFFNIKMKNNFIKLFIFMNLMSLGGLPPFIGFFPKLMIIMNMNNTLMMLFMVLFSLLTLFMYLRIIFSLLMLNSMKMKMNSSLKNLKKINLMMKYSLINQLLLIILMFMI